MLSARRISDMLRRIATNSISAVRSTWCWLTRRGDPSAWSTLMRLPGKDCNYTTGESMSDRYYGLYLIPPPPIVYAISLAHSVFRSEYGAITGGQFMAHCTIKGFT